MNDKKIKMKTTCNNFSQVLIAPVSAKMVAAITKRSESYVKKLRSCDRDDNSEAAKIIIECEGMLHSGFSAVIANTKEKIEQMLIKK